MLTYQIIDEKCNFRREFSIFIGTLGAKIIFQKISAKNFKPVEKAINAQILTLALLIPITKIHFSLKTF